LLKLVKTFYVESGSTYGSPWIHQDLREVGEKCSVNRVTKIMHKHKLKAQIGYKRRHIKGGSTSRIADNKLKRQFNPPEPNQIWVSDITYIRTHEGFLYLATVMDLLSRRIVGWSMDKNMDKQLVINALLMAVYQRQPKTEVMVHSDQGSQYGSSDYLAFMKAHNLVPSMSRQGNCHDNAVAESFFATIKKRIVKRKIYSTREDAKAGKSCSLNFNRTNLLIRIRAARANTKWREHSFSDVESVKILAENFVEQIIEITSSLVSTTRFDPYKNFSQVTIEDFLALARFGSALYCRETVLYFLVRDKEILSYPQKITIDKNEIKIENFGGFTRSYFLNKKAIKLIGLLPINFEGEEIILKR